MSDVGEFNSAWQHGSVAAYTSNWFIMCGCNIHTKFYLILISSVCKLALGCC